MKKMKVLMATAEAEPFAKTGGLGDVLGALPQALNHTHAGCRPYPLLSVQNKNHRLHPEYLRVWRHHPLSAPYRCNRPDPYRQKRF